ncbi:hypothetical protein CMO89_00060 [Candidatus Woesearchaeota archaeon]|nr:hypothetical protein [Candidatus Woesearchaeota archaeon]|tara:strand:- start:2845 stop:3954 length:1110 start_codon:yes stop_codon:yes gene_type:complete
MKISVLGGGRWGTTLAVLYGNKYLNDDNVDINLWIHPESRTHHSSLADYVSKHRHIPKRGFRQVKVPENVSVSDNLEDIVGSDIVISTIPSKHLKDYLLSLKELDFKVFVNASKGVIDDKPISYALEEVMPDRPYAVLSGPNIASEIASNFDKSLVKRARDFFNKSTETQPACSVIAFDSDKVDSSLFSKLEYNPCLQLHRSDDVKSVEYCGILKQAYAMALGACIGLGFKGNAVANFFYLCGKDIKRILKHLKLNPEVYDNTPAGYPDLEVTYKFGRNGRFGRLMAKYGFKTAKRKMKHDCVEGLRIIRSMYDLTTEKNRHLPILDQLYAVVYEGKKVKDAKEDLVYYQKSHRIRKYLHRKKQRMLKE